MAWRRPSQKLKSPTTLTRRAFGANTAKATPSTPSMHDRMRAELVVELEMRAFAEQIEIEVGQNRRKAIGVLQLDTVVAETHAQPIVRPASSDAGRRTSPASWMRCKRGFVAAVANDRDVRGVRKKNANHRNAVLDMGAEIAERVGVAPLDHGERFGRKNVGRTRLHAASLAPHRI